MAQIPDGVRGVVTGLRQPWNVGHQGARAGGHDNIARAEGLVINFHRPGRGDACLALDHLDPEAGIALHRVVGFHLFDH